MPIADIKLVMMASVAVLAALHYPHEVNNWEGLPSHARTWAARKTTFRSAHLKRQRQILVLGGGEPLGGAHRVLPADPPVALNRLDLETALNNLVLATTNITAMLQQLTAANLALTNSVAALTATNKKLVDVAATSASCQRVAGTPPGTGWPPGSGASKKPFPGNNCWTHGYKCSKDHTSATCFYPATGHRKDATGHGSEHQGRLRERQGLGHLTGGDGQCCVLQF